VVLLSQDGADKVLAIMVVAPASASIDDHTVEVKVGAREGLPLEGVVRVALPRPGRINCSWLVTLSQTNLLERVGALSSAKLGRFNDAFRRAGLE
jgi:mRNA interferase MazF